MATPGMHRDFLLEFAGLEKAVQRRVYEVFEKFAAATYAGLHLEKLTHQRDPRIRTIPHHRLLAGRRPQGGNR
ncbi:hypothetical protein SAMN05192584_10652 [Streptomyces pini]|uniref:Uncharacterized protein n=1 Tax=Streptomyces pini TaxID=1520580 RepID=A0A1I3ZJR3_9ACTN|nr:hypothetical protein SAMN05192584_10652 [Streptomyces pini]